MSKRAIAYSLGVMIFLSILAVLLGESWVVGEHTNIIGGTDMLNDTQIADFLDNRFTGGSAKFGIDALAGAILLIAIFITLGSIIGIRVLGSGLAEQSIRNITLGIVYTGVWTVFSIICSGLLWEIQTFGGLIYVGLTIIYAYGVIGTIAGGGI